MSAPVHRVQVFPVDMVFGVELWGWDCSFCRTTDVSFHTCIDAQSAADRHSSRYPIPVQA